MAVAVWPVVFLALPLALGCASIARGQPVDCGAYQDSIVFSRGDPDTGFDLFRVEPDGTGLVHLETGSDHWNLAPRWSPERCHIVYMAYVSGKGGDIRVVRPNGTGINTLMGGGSGDAYSYPDWSPDGGRIAYTWAPEIAIGEWGKTDIWVAKADGSDPLQITSMAGDERGAVWGPVDDRIAFVADVDGNKEIYVVNADGTGVTNLTNHRMTDAEPAWSPDGEQIVFVSNRSYSWEIWIMQDDGTDPRRISNFGSGYPGLPSDPAVSPDGTRLVFSMQPALRATGSDLYVMNIDGTGLANLTELYSGTKADGAHDFLADW